MNSALHKQQEQKIENFKNYFSTTILPQLSSLDDERKIIAPVVQARNNLIFSGIALLFFFYALMQIFEADFDLGITIANQIYITSWGLILMIFAALVILTWVFKAFTWMTIVYSGKNLVGDYQVKYSNMVFKSVGNFLNIPLEFSAVQVDSRAQSVILPTKQKNTVRQQVLQSLELSGLVEHDFTKQRQRFFYSSDSRAIVDDFVHNTKDLFPFSMAELDLRQYNDQNGRIETFFQGVFIEIKLPTKLKYTTYVTTRGDDRELKHEKNWFEQLFAADKTKNIRDTLLEWNEFNNDLRVVTNNEQEARYILTPDFMLTLHEWWKLYSEKIRVSFVHDRLYILVPNEKVVFGLGENYEEFDKHYQYLESLMLSIWYSQELVKRLPRQLSMDVDHTVL